MRDLPPGRPEPTDESVSRTWYRVTSAQRPARTRTPSRILVPALAATLVAGLVVGGAVLFRPGGEPLGFGAPPSADKSSDPNLTPAPPETVAALNALAAAAAAGPPAARVAPGRYIFARHDGWAAGYEMSAGNGVQRRGGSGAAPGQAAVPSNGTLERQIREIWFDPQGMVAVSITDGKREMSADPAAGRAAFKDRGPSLFQPTPEWLATLPTDPDQLRAELREQIGEGGAWSTDHALWSTLQEVYFSADLVMTPELRAALLRSFTGLRGITSSEITVDGRRLVAVRHTERGGGNEILFDPATGSAVGRRSMSLDGSVTVSVPPGAPKLEPGVTYQATWTQKVVAGVGVR
ncbi:hypothetical protein Psuf_048580 [Phytohabitans suffuscus]|uniref:CU044_5270 family protein n=1 Tax=Phytohabitans suffuscus TaxID=624315 RepID=A0A6F8YN30_9ACTN|nr:hypothetical protein Psuf_048580 [Phytohabitans suffuscus]